MVLLLGVRGKDISIRHSHRKTHHFCSNHVFVLSWQPSFADELKKMSKKMLEVKECDVPVVSEDFLDLAVKGGALLQIPAATISEWGASRHSLPAEEDGYLEEDRKFKSGEYSVLFGVRTLQ